MSGRIAAVLDRIEAQQQSKPEPIPDDVPILELVEQVVGGKRKLSREQMRMLIELLPYYAPKLTAIAVGTLNGQDFYTRLDRAVERSERAKVIEAKAVEVEDHE